MAASPVLTIEEIQEHIRDRAENNRLLDGTEFSATVLRIAMDLAISAWNMIPPLSTVTADNFPNKALLMSGTLWKAFAGQAALKARNTFNYSDGGLQVPVEEQFQLYQALAAMYEEDFKTSARALKTHLNIEEGWGGTPSDYSAFPDW